MARASTEVVAYFRQIFLDSRRTLTKNRPDFHFCFAIWLSCVNTQLDASRRGKKMLNSSRDKKGRHAPHWQGRGEEGPLSDPGSELLLVLLIGESTTLKRGKINGTEEKKMLKVHEILSSGCAVSLFSKMILGEFFFLHTLLLSSFWTSRGYRCRPFYPPVLAFNFYCAHVGFSNPTARRFSIDCC